MRVRILKLGAGPSGVREPGMELTVSREEGEALLAAHAAELVAEEREVAVEMEAAVAPAAPERAVKRGPGRPRKNA